MDAVKSTILSVMNYQGLIGSSGLGSQLCRHIPTGIRTEVETIFLDVHYVAQFGLYDQFCVSVKDLLVHALMDVLTTNPNIA